MLEFITSTASLNKMGDSEMAAVGDTKAKGESPEAMFKLAQMLHKGTDGMKADLSRAVCLYQCALEHGYVAAQAALMEILEAR